VLLSGTGKVFTFYNFTFSAPKIQSLRSCLFSRIHDLSSTRFLFCFVYFISYHGSATLGTACKKHRATNASQGKKFHRAILILYIQKHADVFGAAADPAIDLQRQIPGSTTDQPFRKIHTESATQTQKQQEKIQ
jgi:hypothetical protein